MDQEEVLQAPLFWLCYNVERKDDAMKLYITRHGQTQWNREDCIQGSLDSSLRVEGQERLTRKNHQRYSGTH